MPMVWTGRAIRLAARTAAQMLSENYWKSYMGMSVVPHQSNQSRLERVLVLVYIGVVYRFTLRRQKVTASLRRCSRPISAIRPSRRGSLTTYEL